MSMNNSLYRRDFESGIGFAEDLISAFPEFMINADTKSYLAYGRGIQNELGVLDGSTPFISEFGIPRTQILAQSMEQTLRIEQV